MTSRFWKKVNTTGSCWEWTAAKNEHGYGLFSVKERTAVRAHRISAWLYGIIDDLKSPDVVRHKCNNPACVNPEHLVAGTQQDNVDDMVNANRQARGEENGRAKITEADVIAIRADTRSQREIAKDYGVHQTHIGDIKRGKRWSHVA